MAIPFATEINWQLEDYLRILRLHKWIVLATAILFGSYAAYQSSKQPDIYEATARILIEAERFRPVEFRNETTGTGDPYDRSFLMTEYQIMVSPPLLQKVAQTMRAADPTAFAGVEDPAGTLAGMVHISPVYNTNLVDIEVTGNDPELIAKVANAVAETYIRVNLERRQETTAGGVEWLTEEVSKMEEKLKVARRKLQEFQEHYAGFDFGEEQQNAIQVRIEDLNRALSETRKQRMDAEIKYREKHPLIQELWTKEMDLYLALMKEEQQASERSRFAIQHQALLKEVKTNEEIFNILLTRVKELSVQQAMKTNNVQLITPAKAPKGPIGPNRHRAVITALLVGTMSGFGIGCLLETFSKTFRTRRDFDRLMEIPFLGHVPLIRQSRTAQKEGGGIVLVSDPKSTAAEALRAIRTTIDFLLAPNQPMALVVTSSLPEEGKSMICMNLAAAFQELNRKTILIEADMRRPCVHRYFNVALEPGLSDYLSNPSVTLEQVIQHPQIEHLSLPVISAGSLPTQAADLVATPRMVELIAKLKERYQYILIDTPPVLAAADTTILAKLVEGVIYVIRAGSTARDVSLAGKQRLVDVGAKLLGGILNRAYLELEHGYGYYYYRGKRGGEKKK